MYKIITTVALTLVASAFPLFAQEATAPAPATAGNPPAKHEKKEQHNPLINALDANHDKVIDAQEIANAPAALKTLDYNGDGQLARDEYRAPRPDSKPPRPEGKSGKKSKGPKPSHNPLIAALDANSDGVIDAQEIANAPAALKTLDKNADGKLTRDEIHPPRPDGVPGTKDGGRKHAKKSAATVPAPSATPAP